MTKKVRGFSLIEVVVALGIVFILGNIGYITYDRVNSDRAIQLGKIEIVNLFEKYSFESMKNGENIYINLDYLNNSIEVYDKNSKIIEKAKLSKNIKLISIYGKEILGTQRVEITKDGNINPSFSLYMGNKNKIKYRISIYGFSVIKVLKINVYRCLNKSLSIDKIYDYHYEFEKYRKKEWIKEQ